MAASKIDRISDAIDDRLLNLLKKGRVVQDKDAGPVYIDCTAADIQCAMARLTQAGWMAPEKPGGALTHMSRIVEKVRREAPERMKLKLMEDEESGEYEDFPDENEEESEAG